MTSHNPRVAARRLIAGLAVATLAVLGAVAFPMAASAATLTVSTNADAGAGSLRDLVATSAAGDTVQIPASITSILLETEIDITHSLSIVGPGSSLVIDRGATAGINLFEIVGPGVDVTISGMKITASPGDFGVAIGSSNANSVTIDDVTLENQSYSAGSALFFYQTAGPVTISNSTFANNVGTATQDGGAVRVDTATNLTITGSTFSGNSAGGAGAVYAISLSGSLTIDSSTFDHNKATGPANTLGATPNGGALYVNGLSADSTISNSTFFLNTSTALGGDVSIDAVNGGRLTVSASTFSSSSGSDGGGLAVGLLAATSNGLFVKDSAFFDNAATTGAGAGIYVGTANAPLTVQNVTEYDNSNGLGGIYVDDVASALSILSSTIYGPGGVVFGTISSGTALIDHSILFSTDAKPALDIVTPGALLVDLKRDLLSTASNPAISNNVGGSSTFGIADMKLGALANNGGPTLTRLPSDNSPAHNGGDPAYAGPSTFDQRGSGFARKVQAIDIGAVELQTLSLAATGITVTPRLPITGALLILLGLFAVAYSRRRPARAHRA